MAALLKYDMLSQINHFCFIVHTQGLVKIEVTRKYPLRGYILGVLTHTTAWDRHWGGDITLE